MASCPSCGADLPATDATRTGNAQRTVTLEIPEWQFALMRATFQEMSTKLGMHGFGELANQLTPYMKRFDADRDHLRFFEDRAIAMAMTGISWGYTPRVRIGPERAPVGIFPDPRVEVHVDFTGADGQVRTLRVADNATLPAARWFEAYVLDAAQRVAPLP